MFFKKAICDGLEEFFDTNGFDITAWISNKESIDGRSCKVINKYLKAFSERSDTASANTEFYEKLIFAELFLHYAKNKKGDVALSILQMRICIMKTKQLKIVVPNYIREGFKMVNAITSDYILGVEQLKNHSKIYAGPGWREKHIF